MSQDELREKIEKMPLMVYAESLHNLIKNDGTFRKKEWVDKTLSLFRQEMVSELERLLDDIVYEKDALICPVCRVVYPFKSFSGFDLTCNKCNEAICMPPQSFIKHRITKRQEELKMDEDGRPI